MDHFRATCRVGQQAADGSRRTTLLPDFEDRLAPVLIDPLEDLYGGILFHRGRFRRLSGYRRLRATECIAEIATDGAPDWFGQYLPEKLVLGDPAARDAVIHAIQACIPHGTLLPIGVDRLVPGAETTPPLTIRAQERSQDGDVFVYDIEVAGADGCVRERWEGLHLRRVSDAPPSDAWAEPLLGPYVERRLAELTGRSTASVIVEHNGAADRRARSDRAIQQVVGAPAVVHRRPDGRPEVSCDREVSVAHAQELTIAVAGPGPLACDAEPLAPRPAHVWRDLLGTERYALAQLIATRAAEDRDTAATRVWAAAECLKKAAASLDAPLVLRATTDDGWVLLAAGPLSIATSVAPVRRTQDRVVLAVLAPSDTVSPSSTMAARPTRPAGRIEG
jgi:enediyne polyketide synthase